MNYFAHGVRFVDRPYFLAGTALPDWLSVIARQTRLRSRRVAPFVQDATGPEAEIAAGVLQHLYDDQWFHGTPAFYQVTGELTRRFRAVLPPDDAHRPSFLGHIVTEILLDGVLIGRQPESLETYYKALETVDPLRIERAVNAMARDPTTDLATFIPLFIRERFLNDYDSPERLLFRLNQVMRRVKLSPLPEEVAELLREARTLVESRSAELLGGPVAASMSPHSPL